MLKRDIENLKKARNRAVRQAPRKAILENSEVIIDLLQKQLSRGELADGPAPQYAPATEEIAAEERAESGWPKSYKRMSQRYNFKWYGDFFDSMYIRFFNQTYRIWASYDSIRKLKNNPKLAGRDFMALTPGRERKVVKEIVEPEIYRQFLDELAKVGR